ncbi:hypothetical protein O181_021755 [Austropuccinia psidii MF-1]|uniref:PAS domain-containing protein n=1 Tax=Austropuccinia psidii MF-1 TaxID=1389203 RepID=A0A9Q3CG84_9BASI|nr:hypothetical protein [Austropuccinia psidii MF-1]
MDYSPLRLQSHQASLKELQNFINLGDSLSFSRRELLDSLYAQEFQRFLTSKLIEQNRIQLGKNLTERFEAQNEGMTGLGDAFCICDPRLRDNPIVLCSPGFTDTNERKFWGETVDFYRYGHTLVFFRPHFWGPATLKNSVGRIRKALHYQRPTVELLLNYRRDGSPFYCLVSIIPLFDANGMLTFSKKVHAVVLPGRCEHETPALLRTYTDSKLESIKSMYRHRITSPKAVYSENKHSGDFLGRFTSKTKRRHRNDPKTQPGAVEQFDNIALPLQDQYDTFELIYSRHCKAEKSGDDLALTYQSFEYQIIIFKRQSLRVVFATQSLLKYFGLPARTKNDLCQSPVLNTSFLKLVTLGNSHIGSQKPWALKKLKQKIETAVNQGVPLSCQGDLAFTTSHGALQQLKLKFPRPSTQLCS